MTFTEAAIEVLRREGKPLHFKKIAEIAVRESLLDHVGKVPDDTMADQLAAHCRLPHEDRRVIPILSGTFALVEWGMDEDPAGLENLVEPPPLIDVPYRGRERHPIPSRDVARGAGRGERRRREEEGARPRKFPPPAEVAYEILAGAGRPLSLVEIAAQGAERLLMPDAFVRDANALQAALLEDNRRREGSGRRPLFQVEDDAVTLVAQPEPGEKPAVAVARAPVTAADARRAGLVALRRRLRECDGPTLEHVVCRMLEKLGFKELKVAKRGREHVIYTGRRKLGLADVRHGIRVLRTSADVGRRDVTELRRDLGHYGAQIGAVVSAGEAGREARGEAAAPGQLPIVLLCGEALAEAFAEASVGCTQVVVPEVDEAFFRDAAAAADQEEAARRARKEERDRREGREGREGRDGREARRREERPVESSAVVVPMAARAEAADAAPTGGPAEPRILEVAASLPAELEAVEAGLEEAELDGDADDEGDDEAEAPGGAEAGAPESAQAEGGAEPGAAGERRRRRRRRRRRGGRGRGREGAQAAGSGDGAPAPDAGSGGAANGAAPSAPPPSSEPPGGGSAPQE
ncbi:MAG TPA: HTH domain-containing protein [Anaeromyxobacter sp.]|nr:HTH domain-containing protein [Anaeromyxobacter sp.]